MKPDPRLHTRHGSARTAGEKHQRTLTIVTGESPIGLTQRMVNREGFSQDQLRKLVRDVDARHVRTRDLDGKKLSYIEGWYAIAQANAIFGYAGWDREMVHFERVMERTKSDATIICGYMARVRIQVRAGSTEIVREGTGWGSASASTATAAHERALKGAETDATKRALSTFGASFGLNLYDKDHVVANQRPTFTLFTPDGRPLAENLSPESYSTGLRQLIELCKDIHEVDQLSRYNRASLTDLRIQVSTLLNGQGVHFADLLFRLMQRQRERVNVLGTEGAQSSEFGRPLATSSTSELSRSTTQSDRSETLLPASETSNRQGPSINLRPGEVFYRYTVQSLRRRTPYPFPSRSEAMNTKAYFSTGVASTSTSRAEKSANGSRQSPAIGDRQTVDASTPTTHSALPPEPELGNAFESEQVPLAARTETTDQDLLPQSKIAPGLRIDKSKLLLGLERRIRDKAHLKRVAELPCTVCNRQPSHAHHLRFAQRRGLSQKVSDEFVVPLCALHHGDLHHASSEQEWWAKQKIEPVAIASQLWLSHR